MRRLRTRASLAFLLVVLCALLAACGSDTAAGGSSAAQPITLNIFAAASLKDAFTAIGKSFHTAHSNVTLTFNFAGSDTLAQQITQGGAPADVFASANTAQMNVVVKGGDIDGGKVKVFTHNRIEVIFPKSNPAHIQSLQDLARPRLKLVLAAPAVPAGQYARDFLTHAGKDASFPAGYKDAVLKNVVSSEADVKSVLAKVALGEADAGIVYTTDAATQVSALGTLAIPDNLNTIAVYPIGVIKGSKQAATAQQFVDAVLAPDGQATLARFGFLPASQGPQYVPPAGA
jgi:molybdate transport system substrate-binding protein